MLKKSEVKAIIKELNVAKRELEVTVDILEFAQDEPALLEADEYEIKNLTKTISVSASNLCMEVE